DAGYIRVLLQVTRGIARTCAALRAAVPDAVLVHVEAGGLSRAARSDLAAVAADEQDRTWLPLDLLTGQVVPDHALFPWMVRNGASPDELAELADAPPR